MKSIDENVSILGVGVFSGSFKEALRKIENALESPDKKLLVVFTPNPEQVVLSRENEAFRHALQQADLAIPDGVGLVLAGELLLNKKFDPIKGIDLAEAAMATALKQGKRVLLVGGSAGSAQQAVINLSVKSHGLKAEDNLGNLNDGDELIGWDGGSANIANETNEERERVLNRIRDFKPMLLLVAYGAPWQELWVTKNREELQKTGVRVVMVVGGAFDIWAQKVRRAPLQWRKIGLEWLWRLIQEPWRWRRQIRLIRFGGWLVGKVIEQRLFSRGRSEA